MANADRPAPALPTLEEWMSKIFEGADVDKLEIPGRVVIQIAESYHEAKSARLRSELEEARREAAHREADNEILKGRIRRAVAQVERYAKALRDNGIEVPE